MNWKVLLATGTTLMIIVSWTAIRGRAALPTTDNATEKLVIRQIGHQTGSPDANRYCYW